MRAEGNAGQPGGSSKEGLADMCHVTQGKIANCAQLLQTPS